MASRRAITSALSAAQRGGVFWQAACRSGCSKACCVAVPLARAYAAAAGSSLEKVHPPKQSMRTAYKDTDMSHTDKWMQVNVISWQCSAHLVAFCVLSKRD